MLCTSRKITNTVKQVAVNHVPLRHRSGFLITRQVPAGEKEETWWWNVEVQELITRIGEMKNA